MRLSLAFSNKQEEVFVLVSAGPVTPSNETFENPATDFEPQADDIVFQKQSGIYTIFTWDLTINYEKSNA